MSRELAFEEFSGIVREQPGAMAAVMFENPGDDWDPVMFVYNKGLSLVALDKEWFADGARKKVLFTEQIPDMLRKMRAIHYAILLSTWGLNLIPKSQEEAQEVVDWCKLHGVRNHPDAVEQLQLIMGSREGFEFWTAVISRTDDAPPTLGPWELSPPEAVMEGDSVSGPYDVMRELHGVT